MVDICAPSRALNYVDRRRAASTCHLFGEVKRLASVSALLAILTRHDKCSPSFASTIIEQSARDARILTQQARRIGLGHFELGAEFGQSLERYATTLTSAAESRANEGCSTHDAAVSAYLAGRRLGQTLWLLETQPEGSRPTELARERYEPIGSWARR
jgi:hypothetical protein